MILPPVPDLRLVTIRRGGALTDADHHLLALWAASCAEHVLPLFEAVRPDDPRPRQAIEAARAWVRGDLPMMQARRGGRARHGGRPGPERRGPARRVRRRPGRGGRPRRRARPRRSRLRDQGRARRGAARRGGRRRATRVPVAARPAAAGRCASWCSTTSSGATGSRRSVFDCRPRPAESTGRASRHAVDPPRPSSTRGGQPSPAHCMSPGGAPHGWSTTPTLGRKRDSAGGAGARGGSGRGPGASTTSRSPEHIPTAQVKRTVPASMAGSGTAFSPSARFTDTPRSGTRRACAAVELRGALDEPRRRHPGVEARVSAGT